MAGSVHSRTFQDLGTSPVRHHSRRTGASSPGYLSPGLFCFSSNRFCRLCDLIPPSLPPIQEMTRRPLLGFAIGGLAGGEDKSCFWRVVEHCTFSSSACDFSDPQAPQIGSKRSSAAVENPRDH